MVCVICYYYLQDLYRSPEEIQNPAAADVTGVIEVNTGLFNSSWPVSMLISQSVDLQCVFLSRRPHQLIRAPIQHARNVK